MYRFRQSPRSGVTRVRVQRQKGAPHVALKFNLRTLGLTEVGLILSGAVLWIFRSLK